MFSHEYSRNTHEKKPRSSVLLSITRLTNYRVMSADKYIYHNRSDNRSGQSVQKGIIIISLRNYEDEEGDQCVYNGMMVNE